MLKSQIGMHLKVGLDSTPLLRYRWVWIIVEGKGE
jgi:hypothetical protein